MRIRVRLTPRAGRDEIAGFDADGVLQARVAAPPSDGAANDALVRVIAKRCGVAPSRVRVASGATARVKTIEIDGDENDVRRRLSGEEGAS